MVIITHSKNSKNNAYPNPLRVFLAQLCFDRLLHSPAFLLRGEHIRGWLAWVLQIPSVARELAGPVLVVGLQLQGLAKHTRQGLDRFLRRWKGRGKLLSTNTCFCFCFSWSQIHMMMFLIGICSHACAPLTPLQRY
jgi:hypothetical protein